MNVSSAFQLNAQTIEPPRAMQSVSTLSAPGASSENMFSAVFDAAVNNISATNKYLSDAENEKIKLALGQSENTHDLAIATQKASTMLQYTVAIRDKFLEAYREFMNMQF